MRLRDTWRQTGQTLRVERDERAEWASLRVQRLTLWATIPAVLVGVGVLAIAPLSDHQRGAALLPVLAGIMAVAIVAGLIGVRRYQSVTPEAVVAARTRAMITAPAAALFFFGWEWATTARYHWAPALAGAVVYLVLMLAFLIVSRRRARRDT